METQSTIPDLGGLGRAVYSLWSRRSAACFTTLAVNLEVGTFDALVGA